MASVGFQRKNWEAGFVLTGLFGTAVLAIALATASSCRGARTDPVTLRAEVPGPCCGRAMTQIILGLQKMDAFCRETFTLLSTSEESSTFELRIDVSKEDLAEVEILIREAGGTVTRHAEERGQAAASTRCEEPHGARVPTLAAGAV